MNWAGKKWKDLLLGPMTIHGGVLLGSLGLPFFVTPVDLWLSRALLPFKGSPWESFFELTNYLGHGLFLGSLCTALILWGVWRKKPVPFWCGQSGLAAFLSGGLLVQILKHLFGRVRPWALGAGNFFGPHLGGSFSSFPSGHSVSLFALAAILGHALPSWRSGFFALAALGALSRVIVGAHFLSDVVAGAALGFWVGFCLIHLFPASTSESA